ncbi:MAG: glycosyltransferase family 1 protein [Terracidiphilus sp.]
MKVLVAAASFAPNISGLQRHALNLARCLMLQPEVTELHFIIAPWQQSFMRAVGSSGSRLAIHVAELERGTLSRNAWYYYELPKLALRLHADLVHFTFPAPVNARAFHCPTVLTLHDLYPYEIPMNFGFPKYLFNRLILRQCLNNATAIACVSATTRARLRQYTPPSVWQKAARIYNSVEAELRCAARVPDPGWQDDPFLLSIAQHRLNKNLPLLIRVYNRLLRSGRVSPKTRLIIVGIPGPETRRLHQLVSRFGLSGKVRFLEGISEPELQWCYLNSEALVAPSLTEGFGLPVAEALLAGCPVVCSDIPAHREVGAGHCRFVPLDNHAEEAFADAIAAVIQMPKPRPLSLPQFSAPVLARQYVSLYRSLIAAAAHTPKIKLRKHITVAAPGRQL